MILRLSIMQFDGQTIKLNRVDNCNLLTLRLNLNLHIIKNTHLVLIITCDLVCVKSFFTLFWYVLEV